MKTSVKSAYKLHTGTSAC